MTGGSAKARGALEVILFEESRFRGSLMFTSAEVTVGSDPGVMIRLDDPMLAPCHAVLRFDGETCTIENHDALAGTQVNGVAIEHQELGPTDEVQIGRFRLRLTVHRADATPAPVTPRAPVRPAAAAVAPAPKLPPPPVPPPADRSPQRPVAPPALRPPTPPPPTAAAARRSPPPPTVGRTVPSQPRAAASAPRPVKQPPANAAAPPAVAAPLATTPPHAARASARMPAAAAPRPTFNAAPTALAVAPGAVEPVAKVVPLAPPPPPALVSVPAVPAAAPASKRSSTQPLTTRPAQGHASPGRTFAVTSEPDRLAPVVFPPTLDSDDDDDDDAAFTPSFSLLDRLRAAGVAAAPHSAVEVVRFRHGCIFELRHLHRGEKLRVHGMRKPVGRCSGAGGFVFHREGVPDSAAVSIDGLAVDDQAWRARADKRGRIALEPATQVVFPLPSGDGVLIHLVPAAGPLPKPTWRPRLTKLMIALAGASVAVHLVVFTVLGLARLVRRDYIVDSKEGRFARIALKEVELEPPAPPPRPERERKKAKPDHTQTSSEPPPKVATLHLPRHRAPGTPQAQAAATAHKLLSALGGAAAGPKTLSATAMSNLDAAGPIRGGGFKVSGAIGKLPGDSLRLAAAGSGVGRLETRSANDVGKNLGRVLGRGPSGQVRAQVTARPRALKVEGHLDRGEIQRVINSHIHELQGCYERQLIVSPNLSGKVTFEWVIGTGGAVTVVRIKSSTLSSNQATSCMQAAIRRWLFPRPSGGQVTVIYPVALASSGT